MEGTRVKKGKRGQTEMIKQAVCQKSGGVSREGSGQVENIKGNM